MAGSDETRGHGLIVADTFGVVAFYDADNLVGKFHTTLFNNVKIADNAQRNLWGNHGEAVEFLLGKEAVCNLYDALGPHRLALQSVTDEDSVVLKFFNTQQPDNFKQTVAGDMVDDGAVFYGGHHELFSFHRHQRTGVT